MAALDKLLVDSGFLIALFDSREPHHTAARRYLQQCVATLLTVEAVLVEVSFFLRGTQRRALFNAVAAGALAVHGMEQRAYARIAVLNAKYADIDPDYADLSLIQLAESTEVASILTLDERDFAVYRINGRKRFDVVKSHD